MVLLDILVKTSASIFNRRLKGLYIVDMTARVLRFKRNQIEVFKNKKGSRNGEPCSLCRPSTTLGVGHTRCNAWRAK